MHRSLSTLSLEACGESCRTREGRGEGGPANHWKWNGPVGWKEGLLTSFITFGSIKSLGKLSQGQNLVLQHGFQDAGMVVGHQLVYRAGIGPKPEGSLAEQFVHAELTNLQIGAGMALGHALTGGEFNEGTPVIRLRALKDQDGQPEKRIYDDIGVGLNSPSETPGHVLWKRLNHFPSP